MARFKSYHPRNRCDSTPEAPPPTSLATVRSALHYSASRTSSLSRMPKADQLVCNFYADALFAYLRVNPNHP
jgi:hypothetical protein